MRNKIKYTKPRLHCVTDNSATFCATNGSGATGTTATLCYPGGSNVGGVCDSGTTVGTIEGCSPGTVPDNGVCGTSIQASGWQSCDGGSILSFIKTAPCNAVGSGPIST
jgi:hypothetical protein